MASDLVPPVVAQAWLKAATISKANAACCTAMVDAAWAGDALQVNPPVFNVLRDLPGSPRSAYLNCTEVLSEVDRKLLEALFMDEATSDAEFLVTGMRHIQYVDIERLAKNLPSTRAELLRKLRRRSAIK